ncbi:unnamed protein product, partial [Notodromas monacha]
TGASGGADSTLKFKVVRQPFLVERLVIKELSGRDNAALAVVYLSEFKTATSAFILQAVDAKSCKVWCDCFRKARDNYVEAKSAATSKASQVMSMSTTTMLDGGPLAPQALMTSVPSFASDDGDGLHLLPCPNAYSPARSPAPSSRPSRGSSLARSHSGSMDIQCDAMSEANDTSAASRGAQTGVMRPMGSSPMKARSLLGPSAPAVSLPTSPHLSPANQLQQTQQMHSGLSHLSVLYTLPSGQSMPDLQNAVQKQIPNMLTIPGQGNEPCDPCGRPPSPGSQVRMLSPTTRGISYPPPSSRSLKRTMPVPQSRFPPLRKADRVASEGRANLGPVSMSDSNTSSSSSQQQSTNPFAPGFNDGTPERTSSPIDDFCSGVDRIGAGNGNNRRRPVRAEERRYLTAGAVEDIKKHQSMKDSSIHKRLSLNYSSGSSSSTLGAG